MKTPRKTDNTDYEDVDLISDGELDVEEFIDAMEEETAVRDQPRILKRGGWRRVEELRDARWLREQLDDWEDWES